MHKILFRTFVAGAVALVTAACENSVEPVLPPSISVTPATGSIEVGESYQMNALFDDPSGRLDVSAVTWRSLEESIATVTVSGLVRGISPGVARIVAAAGGAADTMQIEVRDVPPPVACDAEGISLAVGETVRYSGGDPLSLCLSGGAEYALVAVNGGSSSTRLDFRGEGLSALSTSDLGDFVNGRTFESAARQALPIDREFERRLRRRERERLSPGAADSRLLSRSVQSAAASYSVGDLMDLSTATSCDAPEMATGRIEYVGERAIVVADTANPGNLSRDVYARFGMLYDTLLYPVVTEHFGEPAGMNGETRVVIFYTRAVNELTSADSDGVVGGYFWAGDIFPRSTCKGSNEREMFYMLAPDPDGTINGNVRTVDFVARMTAGTIAHELQHLINASRRIYVNDASEWEESWLNEGLSHVAEELVFYHASGLAPGDNLGASEVRSSSRTVDAANRYAIPNLLRVDNYLREVEVEGPFQSDDDLATRGASWQFLRYAIDRDGDNARVLLSALVDSPESGLENLESVFGADPRAWYVDHAVSLLTDDHVHGVGAQFTQPSWNFRELLDLLNGDGYVLDTRTLGAGEEMSVRLEEWGSAFVRTAVARGRVGNVQIGRIEAPPSAAVDFVLVRTR